MPSNERHEPKRGLGARRSEVCAISGRRSPGLGMCGRLMGVRSHAGTPLGRGRLEGAKRHCLVRSSTRGAMRNIRTHAVSLQASEATRQAARQFALCEWGILTRRSLTVLAQLQRA